MLALILIGSALALAAIAARQAAHALVRSTASVLPHSRTANDGPSRATPECLADARAGFELVEIVVDGGRSFALSHPPTPILSPVLGCDDGPSCVAL